MEGEESLGAMIARQEQPQKTVPSDKKPQYLITLAVTLEVLASGTILGWTAPALPALMSNNTTMTMSAEEGSWVGSLVAIGALAGALPAGTCADLIGRKPTIMLTALPQILSWVMVYFAASVNTLYIARLIGGVGLGAVCTSVPMYIAEIADDSIRGTLGSSFQLMIVTGVLYSYAFGAIVQYTKLPIICGLLYPIFLLAFVNAPESPIYLMKKNRTKEAEAALRTLRGSSYNIYKELQLLEQDMANEAKEETSFFRALRKRNCILGLIICLGMMAFQQLSGINIIIFYSASIFKDAGSTLDPAIATIIIGLAQVVTTIVAMALIDRLGRKFLCQFSGGLMAVSLAALGYYFHLQASGFDVSHLSFLPLLSVVTYIVVFSVGFGPIPWMIAGEVMSPEIKATGSSISVALNWTLAFATAKVFQPLVVAYGQAVAFWVFAAFNLLAFLFATFIVVETKGKTLNEIQDLLSGKKKRRRKSNSVI